MLDKHHFIITSSIEGCLSLECISTSFFTLAAMPAAFISFLSIILIATSSPVLLDLALYTQANPPFPSKLSTW